MLKKRIIPILLLENNKLVKTINFKNPKYIGDPINAVKIFNEKTVDELVVLDIDASRTNQINFQLIKNLAGECRMPFTYGGGINSLEHANYLFSIGVEKLLINSILFKNPNLVNEISNKFGAQSVVISINLKKSFFGNYKIYDWLNAKTIDEDINTFVNKFIKKGIGEIMITFVDNEGSLSGFDLDSIQKLKLSISIPLVINGGINSLNNMKLCLGSPYIDAIGVGSYFVYYGPHKAVLINYPSADEKRKILDR